MKKLEVTGSCGNQYGHIPGSPYHDVDVSIKRGPSGRWRVEILETWGSCQGHDEERGRRKISASGDTRGYAVNEAQRRAEASGIDTSYLLQALSGAEDAAAQAEEEEEGAKGPVTMLSEISTAQLLAEIRSRGIPAN